MFTCLSHFGSDVSELNLTDSSRVSWTAYSFEKQLHLEKQISKVYGNVNDLGDHQTRLTSFKACSLINKTHTVESSAGCTLDNALSECMLLFCLPQQEKCSS